jgi:hypothetical protein
MIDNDVTKIINSVFSLKSRHNPGVSYDLMLFHVKNIFYAFNDVFFRNIEKNDRFPLLKILINHDRRWDIN